MQYRSVLRTILGLSLALLIQFHASADFLYLDNGDRLTGDVVSIEDGVIQFQTPYAGVIDIDLSAVVEVTSEREIIVQQENGTMLEGRLESRDGAQGLVQDEDWYPVTLGEITLAVPEVEPDSELAELVPEEQPRRWSGTVESGLSMRSGNTDTTDYTFNTTLKRAGTRDVLTLNFAAAYGEAQDVINTRRYRGSVKWQFYPRERLFWYTTASGERDDGRKLDYRAVAGLGIGYDFIESEKRSLSADIGFDYTWEQWAAFTPAEADAARVALRASARNDLFGVLDAISYDEFDYTLENFRYIIGRYQDFRYPLRHAVKRKEDYSNLRIGVDYSQSLLRNSILSNSLVGYGNLEDFGEFRLVNELAFSTPLSDALSLKVSLKSEYDSMAEDSNVESWDHLLVTTLGYRF